MSKDQACQEAFEARLDDAPGEQRWQSHLAECSRCRAQARDLGLLMAPLRDVDAPDVPTDRLEALQERFLAQIRQEDRPAPASSQPQQTPWITASSITAAVLMLLGATLVVSSWLDRRDAKKRRNQVAQNSSPQAMAPPSPRRTDKAQALVITKRTGRILYRVGTGPANARPTHLSPDAELETMDAQAAVTLEAPTRDLRLHLGARSRLRRLAGGQWNLRLEHGKLMAEVTSKSAGASLRIQTPHGTITVKGTQFLVQVAAGKTAVTVLRGVVRYQCTRSGPHLVDKGKRLNDDGRRVHVEPSQTTPPKPAMTPGTSGMKTHSGCRLEHIRRLIQTGRAKAARSAISACRKAGVHTTTTTVLKMLDAQALLGLGKVAAAVRAYHRIARQHRGSRLGQNALFTAGQLELSRLGQRKRALSTFKRYLKRYPSGRYASEARQLIRTLEPGR